MAECRRVLAPDGMLLTCFPQYFQPLESHLGLFTRVPGLHLVFSGRALAGAIAEIARSRGASACWYAHGHQREWERSPYLNGITIRQFREILRDQEWTVKSWATDPVFSDRRRAQRPLFRLVRALVRPLAKLPVTEEMFLGRVCCVLER